MKHILVIVVFVCLSCVFASDGWLNKTAERLEQRDREMMLRGADEITSSLLNKGWVRKERIENIKPDIKKFIGVAKDVDRVCVTKTLDTDEYVIRIIDSEGEEVSLWLSGNEVRAITPH